MMHGRASKATSIARNMTSIVVEVEIDDPTLADVGVVVVFVLIVRVDRAGQRATGKMARCENDGGERKSGNG